MWSEKNERNRRLIDGITATVRASIGLYNTREEIDALVGGLHKVRQVFG